MKKLFPWLVSSAILVVVFGTLYATVQQAQRTAANDPQIQLAEDTAVQIKRGDPPVTLVEKVDIGKSLAPFVAIYDAKGHPMLSSGRLDGKLPAVPIGVLQAARGHEYHAVTWQPKDGVRIAAVTVAAGKDYYVLSGRSLREVEKNESKTLLITVAGGLAAMVLLGLALMIKVYGSKYAKF